MLRSKPALPLVQVVRQVAGEVRGLAVAADHHPVAVVAELGRAQPLRAVLLEHPALLAQPLDRALDRARGVHVVLVEVHVEVDAEVVQLALDLAEHQVDALAPEDLLRVVLLQRVRHPGEHLGGDLVDVRAAVAVLRHRLALRAGEQRAREPVDLRAVVVEVVLPRHLGAGGLQHPRERVADRRPAHPADVDRAGRVGGDELEVDLLAHLAGAGAVGGARLDHGARELARGRRVDGDVEEAGAGDVDARDARGGGQPGGEHLGQRPRGHPGALRQLQRDVRGPVAVVAVAGALHRDGLGHVQGDLAGGDGLGQAGHDRGGELGGCHPDKRSGGLSGTRTG